MANICLPAEVKQSFLRALKNGELDPAKLSEMTSEERRAAFEKVVGGDAKAVNALFESKLLLKNQQAGIIRWAKSVGGLSEPASRELQARVARMEKFLNPDEEKAFLQDLASQKLKTEVTADEAKQISKLAQEAENAKAKVSDNMPDYAPERLEAGAKSIAFNRYVAELKKTGEPMSTDPLHYAQEIAGIEKSLNATGDISFLGRQGWKVFWDHPLIWSKGAAKAFKAFGKQLFKKASSTELLDAELSGILSRKNAYNGYYKKANLAIGNVEEAIPSSLPEKIPLAGRLFKASEVAYEIPAYRMRADLFDHLIDIARKSGVNLDDATLKGIGEFVNSSTGRGSLPLGLDRAGGFINNVFFSARFFSSDVKMLTQVFTGAGGGNFVRRQAAQRLVKAIAGTAAVLTIADRLNPGSVDPDPRSSDFGKIRIGNTRFDVTAGNAAILTLAARLYTHESKSSTTGKITKIDALSKSGKPVYGGQTTPGVIGDFVKNKFSPALSTAIALQMGYDPYSDKKVNLTSTEGAINTLKLGLEPLPAKNVEEILSNRDSAPLLWAMIADALGISTNTYGK